MAWTVQKQRMANQLSSEKKTSIASMLCEGITIRGIERMTGIHRDTIMRLGVRLGEGCKRIMDEKMQNLDCRQIQVDEIWGFVEMKQKTAKRLGAGPELRRRWRNQICHCVGVAPRGFRGSRRKSGDCINP